MIFKKSSITLAIVVSVCICLTSCSSKNLKDQQAQKEIEYVLQPGTQVNVENRVATFTGTFPDEESLKKAESVAKENRYIRSIVNQATVQSGMQLTADTTMMHAR